MPKISNHGVVFKTNRFFITHHAAGAVVGSGHIGNRAYLFDPVLFHLFQPYHGSDSPHIDAKGSTDGSHSLLFLHHLPPQLLAQVFAQHALTPEITIEGKWAQIIRLFLRQLVLPAPSILLLIRSIGFALLASLLSFKLVQALVFLFLLRLLSLQSLSFPLLFALSGLFYLVLFRRIVAQPQQIATPVVRTKIVGRVGKRLTKHAAGPV